MNPQILSQLTALKEEADELERRLLKLKEARASLKTQIGILDLGATCDADFCHDEKRDEPINLGETDEYVHDDQDRGSLSISCLTGDIEIVIYRAVWYDFEEYDRKRITAGQMWETNIEGASGLYDQTNRVQVIGHAESTYNMDFKSWDD
jgi:hypothetical protein